MSQAYEVLKVSKQTHYYQQQRGKFLAEVTKEIRTHIEAHRITHGGCGLKKLYHLMPHCKVGRDEFISIAMGLGFGVKTFKKHTKTTFSIYTVFTNLIVEKSFDNINQVWVTDITYVKIGLKDAYIVFIEDMYSRLILGYCASFTLAATQNEIALKMAFKCRKGQLLKGLIHHSDRGSQYISGNYLLMLQDRKIQISMCNSALDNPYAERLNGIIKNEYLKYYTFENLSELQKYLKKSVEHYNHQRPHTNLKLLTPVAFEKLLENLPVSQRTKLIIPKEHS
jgi:putative transposase